MKTRYGEVLLGAAAALLAGAVAVEQRASAGAAGLVMSYALQITTAVSITVRAASMAENMLNAVERVVEYSSLPPEEQPPPAGAPPRLPPPPGWPQEGAVEFRGVWLRYRPGLPLVLRGVSFPAEARDKIGVVGRTGAGKSSLLGCLFRLVEAERGSILIDELDIGRMALRELRPRLSLIPQVPVLFAGSIRTNLSSFGAHSDAALWAALRRAHLAPTVEAWPAGLDTELTEGGAPLSAGQRQLMALARALLSPARVLVLDEATANVDLQTDALIQSTLRSEFPDRTLLAIAHRLATVIEYTRILVLEAGQVVEYDSPSALLAAPGFAFGRLVDATGEASARQLRALAAGGGGGVQAALARLASSGRAPPPGPGLSRINSTGPGRGGGPPSPTHGGPLPPTRSGGSGFGAGLSRLLSRSRGGGAMASAGGVSQPLLEEGEGEGEGGSCPWGGAGMSFGGGGMGTGEDWDAGVPLPLPALAAAVAGRSCAVARMVQELRREMDRAAEAEAAAAARGPGGGGTVGAAVDDLAMVMGAAGGGGGGVGGGSDDEGGGGGGRGGGGGSAAAADVASLAAARAALGRCVALLDEARAGAVAMKRAWAAGAWGGGGAAAAPPPPLLAPVASGGPAAGAPGAEAPDASA
ncbi:hypothetical protein HYH03_015279 [Edaphochlamys debaryana]|uniref:ABC transporter domain-containing protein n=1 Tax=Edaphochlamys debaryana TaxID=47281 RepID=A0A835XLJ3_9CHLO|nr:hypothetical protein HYH03_015279 [Edaphochlamys debaryana]|eukprot:KAG2486076.1 hypothetical protein HYH03_015279 [Edaphochlamys debaryana]